MMGTLDDATRRVDDNVSLKADGTSLCSHCGTVLGDSGDVLRTARWRTEPAAAAGPCIRADATRFVNEPVLLRRAFCPNEDCLTLLLTEIITATELHLRAKTLKCDPKSPDSDA
jgi:N-methylhydantoinase B